MTHVVCDTMILDEYNKVTGAASYDTLGSAIIVADVNGDGIVDSIIAAPKHNALGKLRSGAVYVIWGQITSIESLDLTKLDIETGFKILGANEGDWSGYSLTAGDVNADGIADIIIGCTPHPGKVCVRHNIS